MQIPPAAAIFSAQGNLFLQALSNQTITAGVGAGSVAGSVGGVGAVSASIGIDHDVLYRYLGENSSGVNLNNEDFSVSERWDELASVIDRSDLAVYFQEALTLHVGPDFVGTSTRSLLDNDGKPLAGIHFGDDGVPVDGYFDVEKPAIVVDEIVSKGGEIVLAGQILSTGNGQLRDL